MEEVKQMESKADKELDLFRGILENDLEMVKTAIASGARLNYEVQCLGQN